MSKFRALVYNIEKLRKEIEDIQKSDDEIKKDQETKTVEVGIVVSGIFNFYKIKKIFLPWQIMSLIFCIIKI